MGKIVRKSLPLELSVGLLLLIFSLSFLLSGQIFAEHNEGKNLYVGMLLVSIAVIIMVIVLWEELLFPVKVKPEQGEVVFRNHRTKLKIQVLIYFTIPVIFAFIYFNYEVNHIRFIIWTAIGTILPVAAKLISGIKNYNDFLKLTETVIEYKNNEKVGSFEVKQVQHITLIKDERNVLHKLQLSLANSNSVIIDLDEMELDAFCDTIDQYITIHYKSLIK
ncbi:MAG TPA: hypothetical protein VL443_09655 [Cyclobacteriaceae bacterium]|jgi:hypothetical protein|nr:hypothetical protein [Cyclobacteriaceae bacterium]